MPRKTATPQLDPIPPLEHPAPVKSVTIVGAPSGESESVTPPTPPEGDHCPTCYGKWGHSTTNVLGSLWTCCYVWCNCEDDNDGVPHIVLRTDVCDDCSSHTGCECGECQHCTAQATCDNCDSCESCCNCSICGSCNGDTHDCECWYCSGCDETLNENHSSCSNCSQCDGCCPCSFCPACEENCSSYNWCSNCDHCNNCCVCEDDDDDNSSGSHGTTTTLEWDAEVSHRDPGIEKYLKIDVVRGMAEHYLLSLCEVPVKGSDTAEIFGYTQALAALTDLAKKEKAALIEVLDDAFVSYVDMAIGGELRHHQATHKWLIGSREGAWGKWQVMREQLGPQALVDAASLFREMSGGIGGEPWALAAEVLHARVTDKMPPWLFVDRVFTMQHNNGSLLNKVQWANESPISTAIGFCAHVGVAHASENPDLALLWYLSRPEIQRVFRQWWVARNRVWVASNERPAVFPKPKVTIQALYGYGTVRTTSGKWALRPEYVNELAAVRRAVEERAKANSGQLMLDFEHAAYLAKMEAKQKRYAEQLAEYQKEAELAQAKLATNTTTTTTTSDFSFLSNTYTGSKS